MKFEIVVAHNPRRGIGLDNKIPWRCKEDLNFFRGITTTSNGNGNNAVIMGTNTWRSLGSKALSGRVNIVISRSMVGEQEGVRVFKSVEQCISAVLKQADKLDRIFVIGGASIYRQFLEARVVSTIYANEILTDKTECDSFFCDIPSDFDKQLDYIGTSGLVRYTRYTRQLNTDESQYLDTCKHIIEFGYSKPDRTGTGTLSTFGRTMRFNLRGGVMPLMTTKRVFWRGVVAELLFFISGATDTSVLSDQNVRIWEGNTSREFLDSRGLTAYKVMEYGPLYGFQWRHWGASYNGCHENYAGKGIDQLQNCIDMIKNDPDSRRIVMSAWNPSDLAKSVLPPCHYSVQFACYGDELSIIVTMRSLDMGCGFPFNLSSYSLLLHMVAQLTVKQPGDIVFNAGDCHVYNNHVDGLKLQMSRAPMEFPRVVLNKNIDCIDGFSAADVQLVGYYAHPPIRLQMSV